MKKIFKVLFSFILWFLLFLVSITLLDFFSLLINSKILEIVFTKELFLARLISVFKYLILPSSIFSTLIVVVKMKEYNIEKGFFYFLFFLFSSSVLVVIFYFKDKIGFNFIENKLNGSQLKLVNSNFLLLNIKDSFDDINYLIPKSFFVMNVIFSKIVNVNLQYKILESFSDFYILSIYLISVIAVTMSLRKITYLSIWKIANFSLVIMVFLIIYFLTTIFANFIFNYDFSDSVIITKVKDYIPIILNFIFSIIFIFFTRKIGRRYEFED